MEIVVVMTKAISPSPMMRKAVMMSLEKKQPATGLLLWTTFWV